MSIIRSLVVLATVVTACAPAGPRSSLAPTTAASSSASPARASSTPPSATAVGRPPLRIPIEPVAVSPVAVTDARPIFGGAGVDRYGYPLATADKLALRAWLLAGRYRELNAAIESFQSEFESDYRKEYWPFDAIDAFMTADPAVGAAIERWIAATPDSFAPYAARAAYEIEVANIWRTTRTIDRVAPVRLEHMNAAHRLALEDTEHALRLRPRLVVAYRQRLTIARHHGDALGTRAELDHALEVCPLCFQVRVTYFMSLRPEWGGSNDSMVAFVREPLDVAANPRLVVLRGFPAWYSCDRLFYANRLDEARPACERALAEGEHFDFYWSRGLIAAHRGDLGAAIADYREAIRVRPQNLEVGRSLADALARHGDYEEGARVFLETLRIEPVGTGLADTMRWWRRTLWREVTRARIEGHEDQARRLASVLVDLSPDDRDARALLEGAASPSPAP